MNNLSIPNKSKNSSNAINNLLEILAKLNQTLTDILEIHNHFMNKISDFANIYKYIDEQNINTHPNTSSNKENTQIESSASQFIEEINQFLEARQFYLNSIQEDCEQLKLTFIENFLLTQSTTQTIEKSDLSLSQIFEIISKNYYSPQINEIHNNIINKINTFIEIDNKIYNIFNNNKNLLADEIKKLKKNTNLLKGYIQPNIVDSAFIDKRK